MEAFFRTIPGLLDAIENSHEVRDAFVIAAWKRVAGGSIAERTEPIGVDGDRLIIAVADKTWQRNLESLASQLLFKLNALLGKPSIDFIEFRIAPLAISKRPSEDRADEDESISLPIEVVNSTAAIRDDRLRNTVRRAAANCLARNK